MRQKELRIALVCYGGVSLAVYMHGVTKELWNLARASRGFHAGEPTSSAVASEYRRLLEMLADSDGEEEGLLAESSEPEEDLEFEEEEPGGGMVVTSVESTTNSAGNDVTLQTSAGGIQLVSVSAGELGDVSVSSAGAITGDRAMSSGSLISAKPNRSSNDPTELSIAGFGSWAVPALR